MAVPWKVNSSSTYAFTQHRDYHENPPHSRPCHLASHRNRAPGAWLYRNRMNVLRLSAVSDSLRSHDCSSSGSSAHGDSSGQNNGVGCHALLQGIFPTQGLKPGLPNCRRILYCLSQQGSPKILEWVAMPYSRGSSRPSDRTRVSCTAGGFFTSWATREAHRDHRHNRLQLPNLFKWSFPKCQWGMNHRWEQFYDRGEKASRVFNDLLDPGQRSTKPISMDFCPEDKTDSPHLSLIAWDREDLKCLYKFLVWICHLKCTWDIWKERGMLTADSKHGLSTLTLLDAVQLPKEGSVIPCRCHQRGLQR